MEKLRALSADPLAEVAVEEPSSERVTTASGGFLGEHRKAGSVRLMLGSRVKEIRDTEVVVTDNQGREQTLANDAVFTMIGREAPLGFFRRSGVAIRGEMTARSRAGLAAFLLFCTWLYHWKGGKAIPFLGKLPDWLSPNPSAWWTALAATGGELGAALGDPQTLLGTLRISASGPSFYYTLAYSLLVLVFGIKRIRNRRTPYVTVQTLTLMAVQWLPLFLLPEILLPWLGHNGWLDGGLVGRFTDALFPAVSYGHGREYWRAYGLILAWPLNVYNWFTAQPLWGWLIIGVLQTFVLIPGLIYFWGKGAYCGWICSCGALAETLGDQQRHKMPHGPKWNRVNMVGQVILAVVVVLMLLRIAGWIWPGSWADQAFPVGFEGLRLARRPLPGRHHRVRRLLLVLGARVVPLRLPPGRPHARLRALLALPDPLREEEVHLVQRVHQRLPPGHRRHELRQQGSPHGGPGVRALLRLRSELSDGGAELRPGRSEQRRGPEHRPAVARGLQRAACRAEEGQP